MKFLILIIISVLIYTKVCGNEVYKFYSKTNNIELNNLIETSNNLFLSGHNAIKPDSYKEADVFFTSIKDNKINNNIVFSKKYQDIPYDMIQDSIGNIYMLVWNEYNSTTAQNTTIIKLDSLGNFIKEYTFGQNNNDEQNTNIFFKNNSLYIFGSNHSGMFVLNIDTDLNYKWAKLYNFGKTYYQEAITYSNKEFYILSWDRYGKNDMVFYKIDLEGNIIKSIKNVVNINGYKNRTNNKVQLLDNKLYFHLTDFNNTKSFIVLLDLNLNFINSYEINKEGTLSNLFNIQNDKLLLYNYFEDHAYINYIDISDFSYLNSKEYFEEKVEIRKHNVDYKFEYIVLKKNDSLLINKYLANEENCFFKEIKTKFNLKENINLLTQTEIQGTSEVINYINSSKYIRTSILDLTLSFGNCSENCGDGSEFDSKVSSLDKFELNGVKLTEIDSYLMTDEKDYFSHGALSHIEPVYVSAGFNSEFAFKIDKGYNDFIDGSLPGADGFSLIFHTDNQHLNFKADQYGGGMGFHNRKNAVALEIDLYNNDEYNDPDGNHIAFQVPKDGVLEAIHSDENTLGINSKIPIMNADGQDTYFCKLEYKDNNLKVWLNNSQDYGDPTLDIPNFKFSDYLSLIEHSKVYVTLAAVTGTSYQKQEVIFWDWCSYYDPISSVEDNQKKSNIIIYPNPSSDMIYIDGINSQENIKLFDLTGRKIISQNYNNGINISDLKRGIYILKLNNQNYKIIKE